MTATITAVIRGTVAEAETAAAARGVTVLGVLQRPQSGEVLLTLPLHHDYAKIVAWWQSGGLVRTLAPGRDAQDAALVRMGYRAPGCG